MKRDYLIYQNLDLAYYRSLIDSAAEAFVRGTEFGSMGVLLGMINKQVVDDYRSTVAKKGGNSELAIDHLFAAHLKATRFKAELAEGAAVMSRLASVPAEELTLQKFTG